MASISERESGEIEAANASGNTPVVFIHGLWLLPTSWANWADFFKQAGYAPLTPDWPDDPETVEEARANPDVLAKKTLKQIAHHTDGARLHQAVRVTAKSGLCQRRSVPGVTKNELQRWRGTRRLAAARNARSALRSAGRATWRRRIASSWRSTTISSSLNSSERQASATSCHSRCRLT